MDLKDFKFKKIESPCVNNYFDWNQKQTKMVFSKYKQILKLPIDTTENGDKEKQHPNKIRYLQFHKANCKINKTKIL